MTTNDFSINRRSFIKGSTIGGSALLLASNTETPSARHAFAGGKVSGPTGVSCGTAGFITGQMDMVSIRADIAKYRGCCSGKNWISPNRYFPPRGGLLPIAATVSFSMARENNGGLRHLIPAGWRRTQSI